MEFTNTYGGRRENVSFRQLVTREEYEALMAELALAFRTEPSAPGSETDTEVERFESNMMVFAGLCGSS